MKNLIYFFAAFFLFNFILLLSVKFIPKSNFYQNHYLASTYDVRKNLKKNDQQKRILLLGGSSMGWGVSAQELTKKLNIQSINAGVHAAIGYSITWDMYKENFNKKDLIIISPEYGSIKGINTNSEICTLTYLNIYFKVLCIPSILDHHIKNIIFSRNPNNEYSRNGFNTYGDHIAHLSNERKNFKIKNICSDLPSKEEQDQFINFYLNKINAGYNIIFIPTIIPKSSCEDGLPYLRNLVMHFSKSINGVDLFDKYPLTLDDDYFYDTEYHLTKDGIQIKTDFFIDVLSNYYIDD